jgi:hypothetical protein
MLWGAANAVCPSGREVNTVREREAHPAWLTDSGQPRDGLIAWSCMTFSILPRAVRIPRGNSLGRSLRQLDLISVKHARAPANSHSIDRRAV